ncbi:MAG: hypothetical protein VX794_09235 [Nitrospinota bacterium]|nr:hypothetical protein [Nitrospinota bacterium]
MVKIPEGLKGPINNAYPKNVCLVGTVQPDGWSQISPKGSVCVYKEESLVYWDRGSGSTFDAVTDGTKVMIFFRSPEMREKGILPMGGIARFYGRASVFSEGPIREEVWNLMVQPERDHDPDKKGRAVVVKIERSEDLSGDPL